MRAEVRREERTSRDGRKTHYLRRLRDLKITNMPGKSYQGTFVSFVAGFSFNAFSITSATSSGCV
jgi:hypothetical protein